MTLAIENLSVNIGAKTILKNINLQCEAGQLITLCGPNGAGKSPLLKAITGEMSYSQGKISLQGNDMQKMSAQQLALKRAVLPQHVELAFAFSVEEVISIALLFTGDTREKQRILDTVIDMMELQSFIKRDYSSLSGGEKQRVQLARVLAQLMQPQSTGERFLLLDECTSAMDMAWMHKAFALLKQQTHNQIGIIAVVHDLNLASLYADKMVLLSDQQARFSGTPEEVITASIIKEVFATEVSVIEHPQQRRPVIIQQALQTDKAAA